MRAVDALMECLKAEGVDVVFGLPGGANLPTYDAFYDAGHPPHPRPPRGRRRPRRRGLREGDRQGRRVARDERPRRDQPGHADLRRDDGLGPGRVPDRPGPHRAARHRRVPGGGHDRDHDADRQAQLHDPAPAGAPALDPRGVPHRAHRPARTGRRRHPAGPEPRRHPVRAGDRRSPARLPADDRGQPEADPARRQGAGERAAAGDLRRRRRGQRQRGGRADRAGDLRPVPGHLHGDGARRRSRRRTTSGSGCSACTAPGPPTTRWTRPT